MNNNDVLNTILGIIEDTAINNEVEKRFTPILGSEDLKTSITNLSLESPVFQSSLSKLSESLEAYSQDTFTREYENFYNNVMIISDELSLVIKKEADQIKEINLPVKGPSTELFVSSRIFVGNSVLLGITSNDEIFEKTLEVFEKKNNKSLEKGGIVSA